MGRPARASALKCSNIIVPDVILCAGQKVVIDDELAPAGRQEGEQGRGGWRWRTDSTRVGEGRVATATTEANTR